MLYAGALLFLGLDLFSSRSFVVGRFQASQGGSDGYGTGEEICGDSSWDCVAVIVCTCGTLYAQSQSEWVSRARMVYGGRWDIRSWEFKLGEEGCRA